MVTKRDFPPDVVQEAIAAAEEEIYRGGIVAVGDIGNTADTAGVKSRSRIRWQNFTEVLSFTDDRSRTNGALPIGGRCAEQGAADGTRATPYIAGAACTVYDFSGNLPDDQ